MGTFTSNRRILVIGSQCASLPPPFSFLPQAAVDLHAVMTDPEVGGCTDAAPGGLLIDPTVAAAKAAIKDAFRAAAAEEATLLLALIGHGTYAGRDFYLLPHDGVEPPDSDTGVQLVQLVKEQHRLHPVDGLVVLIDTCFSGVGALAAATSWVSELEGALRFEMLTAAPTGPPTTGVSPGDSWRACGRGWMPYPESTCAASTLKGSSRASARTRSRNTRPTTLTRGSTSRKTWSTPEGQWVRPGLERRRRRRSSV